MKLFLDTSAFAKRQLAETGSGRVVALCAQANSLTVSVICLPELVSTLARHLCSVTGPTREIGEPLRAPQRS